MTIKAAFWPMSGGAVREPFDPNQVLIEKTGPNTYSGILPVGVYDLIIAGGGGEGRQWNFGGVIFHNAGGSGAVWEGQFYNPTDQQITLYAGNVCEDSFLDLGGVRMITAGKGQSSVDNGGLPGDGGIVTVNGALQIIQQRKAQNGNKGSRGSTGTNPTASVCSIYNWGQGSWGYANNNPNWIAGGTRLQYLRME